MPNNCDSYSVQINNTYKKIANDLLNLFTEFNSQNESLVATLNDYSSDINTNKENFIDVLDEYILVRMQCCYNIVLNIDRIIELFEEIPCIEPNVIPTTTVEPTTTQVIEPTTTLDGNICNAPTVIDERGSYYPYTVNKFLGAETGLVTLTFTSHDIPDRFVVEFDGVDVIDTGYVGNPIFQTYLDAAVYLEGDVAGDINNIVTGSVSFLKLTATDNATVKVYSPLGNTRFEFELSCPNDAIVCQDIILDVIEIDFETTTLEATTTEAIESCALDGELECDYEPTTTSEATTTVLPTTTIEPTTTIDYVSDFYVGVGGYTNTLGYSYDGINWTGLGADIFTSNGTAVAYNGTMWVAVGSGSTNSIAYSYNGIDWVGLGKDILWAGREIVWNGTLWVAVGSATNDYEVAAYSYNGIDWVAVLDEDMASLYSIFWDGNRFLAGGTGDTNNLMTSTDGIDWTIFTSAAMGYWLKLTYNGTIWVATGYELSGDANKLAHSFNGTDWIGDGSTIFSTSGESVAWNGVRWVAVGQGTNTVAYSDNGIDWTPVTENVPSAYGGAVIWDGIQFIVGGSGVNNISVSPDGINWTAYNTGVFDEILNFSSNKSKYFYPPIS